MRKVKNKDNICFWGVYTVLFVTIAAIVFCAFILKGNSFINTADGFNQTYPALIYIGRWLRESVFGKDWKQFDFSIGIGEGVISALSYLGFGDIFTALSALVKPEWTAYLFNFIVLLKLYMSGVTFSLYCRYHRIQDKYILIGVFFYVFSRFTLVTGLEFCYNLTPVVWLPLLLLGIDKIMEDESRNFCPLFIIVIFIQGINGFYYLYMETIICIVYFGVKCIFQIRGERLWWKELGKKACNAAGQYILGLSMAGGGISPGCIRVF